MKPHVTLLACAITATGPHPRTLPTSTFPEPIKTKYRGVEVYEVPPNGQGITALIGLNILEGFDVAGLAEDHTQRLHIQIEVRGTLTHTCTHNCTFLCPGGWGWVGGGHFPFAW
jgi:hypothetical protein